MRESIRAGIAAWTKKMVVLLFVVAVAVALALVTGQKPFSHQRRLAATLRDR